jgi:TonB-linked SusC/RagA family outer membrane protein
MAGASTEQANIGSSTDQYFQNNFPNDAITKSFDGNKLTVKTNLVTELTPSRLTSFFGRASYDYDDRYMVSASLRVDGGSVFGADHKWGTFPALSGGWMISKEKFWRNSPMAPWWDTFKLRASFGVTGNNQISSTAAYSTLTNALYGGYAGYYANTIANKDLSWEKTYSTDVAMDFAFLKNRLQMSLDWYTKTTKDLLYQVPVVGASGFTTAWDNLGEIRNWGLEMELTSHNLTGKFKWNTSFNISYNKNKVISLGTDDTPIYSGWNGVGDNGNTSNVLMVGHPANAFYMLHAIGVWKNQAEIDAYAQECGVSKLTFNGKTTIKPGDIKYEDVNHDGDYSYSKDRVFLGQPTPKVTFGLTNTFEWKGFDASVLITGQFGGRIYGALGRAIDRPSMGAKSNVMDCWTNAWWSEDEVGDGKTPYILSTTTGGTCDSRWLYSSDYVSLKNLTLGYTVPLKSNFVKTLRVFVSLENLLRYDHYYEGYSPEAANTARSGVPGGTTALGIDYGGYPTAKSYNLGVNITF